jgi:hypothetical protein
MIGLKPNHAATKRGGPIIQVISSVRRWKRINSIVMRGGCFALSGRTFLWHGDPGRRSAEAELALGYVV